MSTRNVKRSVGASFIALAMTLAGVGSDGVCSLAA